jgi:excisionase family DNA binding protein
MTVMEKELAYPGFTVGELEKQMGLPYKTLYRLIREGEIEAYKDVTGKIRVSREEAYRYMRNR